LRESWLLPGCCWCWPDTAIGGGRVVIRLTVRRFFCGCPGCKRTTFAEQVPGLAARSLAPFAQVTSSRSTCGLLDS